MLITLSHGSRRAGTTGHIVGLTEKAGQLLGVPSAAAYLDFNTPDLLGTLREHRPKHAIIVPTLFSRAFHARFDVPAALREARAAGFRITLAQPLGSGADIARVLAATLPADATRIALYAVGSSDESANTATRNLARLLSTRLSTRHAGHARKVEAIFATRNDRLSEQLAACDFVAPLFVTDGRLLELARTTAAACGATGPVVGEPLGSALAGVVAQRYRAAAFAATVTANKPTAGPPSRDCPTMASAAAQ